MSNVVSVAQNAGVRRRKIVVIIDDHPLVSVSLRDLIVRHSLSVEVRSFSTFSSSVTVLQSDAPSLVILDFGLPDINGCVAIRAVLAAAPAAQLVVLSGNEKVECDLPGGLKRKIRFLHKGLPYHVLSAAIRELLAQCELTSAAQISADGKEISPARYESLSPKQRAVLRLLATGRTNQEIAVLLSVSVETIKSHLRDIYVKLQVKSRTQAVLLYQAAERLALERNDQNLTVA